MKIKVIKVMKNGKEGYLNSATIFDSNPIVNNPLEAKNYATEENSYDLDRDIDALNLPNQEYTTRSGLSVDSATIVEIECSFKEVSFQNINKDESKLTFHVQLKGKI